MANYDWSKFCKRITVGADLHAIYDAWTTSQGIEKWFLKSAEYSGTGQYLREKTEPVQDGDLYKWKWFGYSDDMVETGVVINANGKDFLKFSFAGSCTVSVTLKQEEDELIVELWQENIPADEAGIVNYHLGCSNGWTFYLTNLKSILEKGIDLRNKSELIKKVVNS